MNFVIKMCMQEVYLLGSAVWMRTCEGGGLPGWTEGETELHCHPNKYLRWFLEGPLKLGWPLKVELRLVPGLYSSTSSSHWRSVTQGRDMILRWMALCSQGQFPGRDSADSYQPPTLPAAVGMRMRTSVVNGLWGTMGGSVRHITASTTAVKKEQEII